MNKSIISTVARGAAIAVAALSVACGAAQARIAGWNGPSFQMRAGTGFIETADGGAFTVWGYGMVSAQGGHTDPAPLFGAPMTQYPGPTLIVNQGDTVTVDLVNSLPVATSIVFPGMTDVVGGGAGAVMGETGMEAPPGGTVSYTFTASRAGTFQYHSGSRPDLQTPMGLFGALIVRPTGYDELTNRIAYDHPDTNYDHEHLYLLSEIDPNLNQAVAFGTPPYDDVDTSNYTPTYWFINGRVGPDTLDEDYSPWLYYQPYGAYTRAHPCERVLMRMIGAGRDLHPFHYHGNHAHVVGRDGALLSSDAASAAPVASVSGPVRPDGSVVSLPDLSWADFTVQVAPGSTYDAIFEWTGHKMGWDIYGHGPGDAMEPCEDPNDHGKPIPVVLPGLSDLTFGGFWSGSPFLGKNAPLPPGEGGLNPNDGMFFMWHSHSEKELTNGDVFPGGMMTMFVVEPPDVPIE